MDPTFRSGNKIPKQPMALATFECGNAAKASSDFFNIVTRPKGRIYKKEKLITNYYMLDIDPTPQAELAVYCLSRLRDRGKKTKTT
jgi:hypothetical protein